MTVPIPRSTVKKIYELRGGLCEACGTSEELQIHHKLYRSRGRGRKDINAIENLALLCYTDHNKTHSGDKSMARFRTRSWQKMGESEVDLWG